MARFGTPSLCGLHQTRHPRVGTTHFSSLQMEKAAVPKFGSFKPKVASQKAPPEVKDARTSSSREKSSRREHQDDRRERDRHNRHRDDGSRDGRRSQDEHRHRKRDDVKPRSSTPRVHVDEFEESDSFIIDLRGDAKNVQYGSLHRYSVPAYHRTGYGHVIGLPSRAKIDREASSEKEVVLNVADRKHQDRLPRLLTGKAGRPHEIRLRYVLKSAEATTDQESDYLELRPSRKRKRGSESPQADGTAIDYRSIEGKTKAPTRPADEDLDSASDSETGASDDALDLQARQQNAMLSKAAKTRPSELQPWLTLSEHQTKMVHPGVDIVAFTSSERRTLADLRMSILQQAASHISRNSPDRDQLLLTMIEEGSVIWDSTKLSSRWKEALAECPSSTLLWMRYLDHIQDQHTGFRYDQCKASFLQCMEVLRDAFARCKGEEQSRISKLQVYALLRLTTFIRDAGYAELALATWQAILEYHFFTPSSLAAATVEDRLEFFESFWESEVPRIGEQDAQGWHRHHGSDDDRVRQTSSSQSHPLDSKHPWSSFAKHEASMNGFCLPASADDDDAVADPFRCVMFSDIRDVLESTSASLDLSTLVDGFLPFLELPTLLRMEVENDTNEWTFDPHTAANGALHTSDDLQLPHDKVFKLRQCRETSSSLFAPESSAFEAFRSRHGQDVAKQELVRFVDNLLHALIVRNKQDDVLAEYYLAFKLQLQPEKAAKAGKRLLKERSSSLRLYNAYALIEARLGHDQKAQTVWTTALKMQDSLGIATQDDAVILWHSRMLNAAVSSSSALQHLLDIGTDGSGGETLESGDHGRSIDRLKATRKLQEGFDRMMLAGKQAHAALYADLLAWLAYFSSNHDLGDAFGVYEKCSSRMSREGAKLGLELLHQYKACLIKHHIKLQRPYKPAVLRQELESSLSLFPNNSILIDLSQKLAAQDRLRTLVHDQKITESSQMTVVQWSSKISGELRRTASISSGSTINTVRATFNRALLGLDSKVKHAPALWFMWLRFECHQANKVSGKQSDAFERAKQVFLDGIRYLPWHKHWAIAGMGFFSERGMSEAQLRQIHDTLVDRGLRLRIDVEGVL